MLCGTERATLLVGVAPFLLHRLFQATHLTAQTQVRWQFVAAL